VKEIVWCVPVGLFAVMITHSFTNHDSRARDSLYHWRTAVHCRPSFLCPLRGIQHQEHGTARYVGCLYGLELWSQQSFYRSGKAATASVASESKSLATRQCEKKRNDFIKKASCLSIRRIIL